MSYVPLEKVGTEQITPNIDGKDAHEIAAVIAAAIQVFDNKLIIKTIKRVTGSQGSSWAQMSRIEAMNLRNFN